ncbi:MAG: Rid family detoxifying hydrolase [Gammaproteobacteria bacterium]|nr:Rid family detoxifying hydrolase [Gammaproteobacteria bacterium]MDH3467150.1 Rid family detoxifying hydrolase [Gammaproteobacteria bacterium]
MSRFETISTDRAPQALGTYSQAVRDGDTVYLSGQIPLDPVTMEIVSGSTAAQIDRVFLNLEAVAEAAGGSLAQILKFTIYLSDLADFPLVNAAMERYLEAPYPARVTVGVAALPKGAAVEIDAILSLTDR